MEIAEVKIISVVYNPSMMNKMLDDCDDFTSVRDFHKLISISINMTGLP